MKRSLHGGTPPARKGVKSAAGEQVPRPDLPRERPELPGGVMRDIKRTVRLGEAEDVLKAVAVAGLAIEEGDLDRALELLRWARSRAPRSTAIREGLGVALYLAQEFEEAQRELQAYRRMTGRHDQNHLLADISRALGRPDRVTELVDELVASHRAGKVGVDRLVEALIVQAGMRAEAGDHVAALAGLERAPLPPEVGEVHGRLWYAAGDIAEQMGERAQAREYFEAVLTVDEDFLDAAERAEALS